uniref:X1.B.F11.1 n=1 Tax=Schmidtea mediterranea TaxID=79327 RepID=V9XRN2_SCHMD|nr:X1.B.F11.1 [Schmidtea mediterranea]
MKALFIFLITSIISCHFHGEIEGHSPGSCQSFCNSQYVSCMTSHGLIAGTRYKRGEAAVEALKCSNSQSQCTSNCNDEF